MLHILEKLQHCQIIHGDIKPDNFLVTQRPELGPKASLQMIDFGVSIDMKLFHPGQSFKHKFDKVANRCPQMIEDQPWNYHLDYYGVASVAHTLLHGSYMKLSKKGEDFVPNGSLKRWWNSQLWNEFFGKFLNIKDNQLPNVAEMRDKFEQAFLSRHAKNFEDAASELNKLMCK